MRNSLRRVVGGGFLFISSVLACSSRDTPEEKTAVSRAKLTAAQIANILGFETTIGGAGSDWVPSGGTVGISTVHAFAGSHSMVMTGTTSISVQSIGLGPLGNVGTNLSLQIWLPTTLSGQSNKGNVQAFLNSTSIPLNSYATGNVALASLTPGQFSRIDIPLDSTLQSKLKQTNYSDLQIKLIFNLADMTNQTWVDNLDFNVSSGGSGGASGTGGSKSTGSSSGLGGTKSSGGVTNAGGTLGSGGTSSGGGSIGSGGAPATGGKSPIGGSLSTGGKFAAGGSTANGGSNVTGGTTSTGGSPSTGGSIAAGGSAATGGGISTGGSRQTGGTTFIGSGGTPSSGGLVGQGGIIVNPTGGSPNTGGTIATGGAPTGGNATGGGITGGSPASGGTTAGGNTAAGGSGGSFDVPYGMETYTFSFELPPGVNRDQVVLGTTKGDLWVDDGVTLLNGSEYASVSSVDNGKVNRIGVSAQVENAWSGGDTTLSNYAVAYGSVESSGTVTQQSGATVLGGVTQQADLTPLQIISWTVKFPGSELPTVNLQSDQTLAPGGYPAYDVKTGAHLLLSTGTYYFQSLILEPGSTLSINNASGPVFIYLRFGYTQRGTVSTVINKANVLFGVADTNPVVIDSSLNGVLVVPDTSVSLSTNAAGHAGAVLAKSITAHQNTTITLKALEPSNFCGPNDACSSFCPCTGAQQCTSDSDCAAGSVCGSGNGAAFGAPAGTNVCWPASCATTGGVGSQCGRFAQGCQVDTDCPSGQICGASNGAQFQFLSSRVCWPAQCATDPTGTGCGTIQSPCGLCPSSCTPSCATKKCGDSSDDGCGGQCTGYCNIGDVGCTSSTQCAVDSVCSTTAAPYFGKTLGQSVCWPRVCDAESAAQRACGTPTSQCGPQCPSASSTCVNRQCGIDPTFGTNCGTCSSGQYCDPSGKCQANSTDVVSVPVPMPVGPETTTPVATDVGAIPATLSVSPQGKAHYSVPLFVSPGVGGLTPGLSLEYESNQQDGDLGVGWSVGGLSSIARCPRAYGQGGLLPIEKSLMADKVTTLSVKKPETAINYVDTDQFCLDGSALVLVSESPGEGAEYRTEQDTGVRVFMRMNGTASNTFGPDHFDVYSPDGRVSQYGGSPQVPGFASTGYETWSATGTYGTGFSSGVRTTWALNHVQDTLGNTIDYVYFLAPTVEVSPGAKQVQPGTNSGQMTSVQGTRPVIASIFYGGSASLPANRTIKFTYQPLGNDSSLIGNQRFGWMSGNPYAVESRLATIGMYFEGEEIRKYMLQYDGDTRRSKVSSLYECAQQHCKQPTNFTYKTAPGAGDGGAALDLNTGVGLLNISPDYLDIDAIQTVFDLNGDGLPDLLINDNLDRNKSVSCDEYFFIALATGDRTKPYSFVHVPDGPSTCKCLNSADLDGDGKSEIYATSGIDGGIHQFSYDQATNTWASYGPPQPNPCGSMADFDGDGVITTRPDQFDFAIDTDGDGIPNTIQKTATYEGGDKTSPKFYIANQFEQFTYYTPPGQTGAGTVKNEVPIQFDLGMPVPTVADSAASQDSYIRAHMNGSTAQPFIVANWSTGLKVVDVNGDGLKDIFTWTASAAASTGTYKPGTGPTSYLLLWTNTGRNQFTNGVAVSSLISNADRSLLDASLNAGTFQQAFAYDINRDGLEDLVFPNINSWITALISVPDAISGAKFRLQQVGQTPSFFQKFEIGTGRVIPLDVDGDGVTDLVMGSGYQVYVMFQHGFDHDLLDTVTDGNGKKQSIAYISGKATGYYTDSSLQSSTSKPAHILPPTVSSVTTSKADGLQVVESYKYQDGRIGYYGRGLLGFTEVDKTVTGSDIGVVSDESTFYHPDSLKEVNIGAQTTPYEIYYEAGRPWKHTITKHNITTGLGTAAKVVDNVITETRTLQLINSSANVPMWLPYAETVTESEVDASHNEQLLTTTSKTYTFDQYGMPTSMSSSTTGSSGQALQSRSTSASYKRDQSFLDKNLIGLPVSVTSQTTVAGDIVTHNEDREYYDSGLTYSVTTEPDKADLSIKTEYVYNSRGNPTSVIESGGGVQRETDYYYDAYGDYVETTVNALLQTTTHSYYRGYGQLALVQDANGLVSWRGIDVFGRETGTTDANSNSVVTPYEAPGTEASFLTAEGRSIAFAVRKIYAGLAQSVTFHDSFGHDIGTTTTDVDVGDAPLHSQVYYDSLGRRTYRSHTPFYDNGPSEQQDHVTYDNMNRPTSITIATDATPNKQMTYLLSYGHPSEVAGSSEFSLTYGARAVTTTFPNQSKETKITDSSGRPLYFSDRNGSSVSYTYGATGRLLTFTDQAGLTTQYQYDRYGRTVQTNDPIRGVTQTIYTALGNYVQKTTPTGEIDTYYDLLNRPTTEMSPDGGTSWTYDNEPGAVGRVVKVTGLTTTQNPVGNSVHYSYGLNTDAAGNRGKLRKYQSSIGTETFAIDYDYDQNERLSTTHFPAMSNGQRYAVTNQYTSAGRLNAVVEAGGGEGRTLWKITARDPLGRKKTEQALGVATTDYEFTNIDGLLSNMRTFEGATQESSLSYGYDWDHNVTIVSWFESGQYSNKSRLYAYDPGGRITDEFVGIYANGSLTRGDLIEHTAYLSDGNISAKSDVGSYTYDKSGNPYAVTVAGDYSYEYDGYGRVTHRTAPYIENGQQDLTWTTFDAVSTITDGADANKIQTSYEYNGLKERVLETNPAWRKYRLGGIYQRTDDLVSGNRLHSLQIQAGAQLIAEVQFTDDGAGTVGKPDVYSILMDRMGSTTIVRDPSGNYIKRTYDAFGKASDHSPLSTAIGFAGYTQDDDQSLLWMNNRPYDPVIGRALTLDPIINSSIGQDSANRYAYAYNRPTAFIDPSGFFSIMGWCIVDCGGGGPSIATNPVSSVNPGGKTGIVMNQIMATSDDSNAPRYYDPAEGRQDAQIVLVPTTSGEIVGEPEAVPTDEPTRAIAGAAITAETSYAAAVAALGDGAGDGTCPASATRVWAELSPGERVDRAYRNTGLNWAEPPFYDPTVPRGHYAETGSDPGVQVGPTGVEASEGMLESSLIHEDVHVQQILTGNYAKGGSIGGVVNEMEGQYKQLETAAQTGLSDTEYNEINRNLWVNFQKLGDAGSVGYNYRMQILVYGNFTLRPEDVSHAPPPKWLQR